MANNFQNNKNEKVEIPTAQHLPTDYVDEAQSFMDKHKKDKKRITTTKIRSILSMVSEIYNEESRSTAEKLSPDSMANLQLLRVRMVYEYGRNPDDVGTFIIGSKLINYLLDIGDSREKFINYAHYVEALVAYHRFFGGKNV